MFVNLPGIFTQIRLKVYNKQFFTKWARHVTEDYQPISNGGSIAVISHKRLSTSECLAAPQRDSSSEFSDSTTRMVKIVPGKGMPPAPPTCCCSTGCHNCVWIQYVDELVEYYKDGGIEAARAIEQISDENIKAFIKIALITKL